MATTASRGGVNGEVAGAECMHTTVGEGGEVQTALDGNHVPGMPLRAWTWLRMQLRSEALPLGPPGRNQDEGKTTVC